MKELSKEDRLLIIEAISEYLQNMEEWPVFEDGEDINKEYVKELTDLLERLRWIK